MKLSKLSQRARQRVLRYAYLVAGSRYARTPAEHSYYSKAMLNAADQMTGKERGFAVNIAGLIMAGDAL